MSGYVDAIKGALSTYDKLLRDLMRMSWTKCLEPVKVKLPEEFVSRMAEVLVSCRSRGWHLNEGLYYFGFEVNPEVVEVSLRAPKTASSGYVFSVTMHWDGESKVWGSVGEGINILRSKGAPGELLSALEELNNYLVVTCV